MQSGLCPLRDSRRSHRDKFNRSSTVGITVVIPTYNRCHILNKVLDALRRQTTPEHIHEVIIVDDGSSDSTHQVADRFSSSLPIRYMEQAHTGVSAARNLGLREASTSIVLFLDDDVVPSPQLIYEHYRFHKERSDTQSVLLGYVTWHADMVITPFMRWYGEFGALFRFSLLKDEKVNDPRYLYTCNLSFKSDFLRDCGGLNESLSVMEDHELGFRLRVNGMRMYYRRAAIGYHYQSFTFEEACQRLERYSPGLGTFLLTDAGREMTKRRKKLPYSLAEAAVKIIVPALSAFRFLLDSNVRLPNAIYRMFYWYYGTYLSFWSHVER